MVDDVSPKGIADYRNFLGAFQKFSIETTKHANQRMQQHGVTLPDLRRILRRGGLRHVERDIRTGEDKYRVAGSDIDDRPFEVVVVLDTTGDGCVVVVTVIDPESGSRRRGGRRPPGRQRTETD